MAAPLPGLARAGGAIAYFLRRDHHITEVHLADAIEQLMATRERFSR